MCSAINSCLKDFLQLPFTKNNTNYKFFKKVYLKVSVSVSAKISAICGIGSIGIGIGEYLSIGIGIGRNFGIGVALDFLATAFNLSLNERQTAQNTLLFVSLGVKLNSQRYVENILESCLLPWTNQHSQDEP